MSSTDQQAMAALAEVMESIQKAHGAGSIMVVGQDAAVVPTEAISTSALPLDIATGIGGIPRGRITEIYGPESSGKTTVCLQVVANVHAAGGWAAFVDTEHALDMRYARALGVDPNRLILSQPDYGEQALEIAEALIRSRTLGVVVVDSVAALVPRAEIEGEMGDAHVGLQARLMSQALRKIVGQVRQSRTAVIFTNQLREKIGVTWGSPETTSGGRALKFYASMRLDIRRIGATKDGSDVVGNRTRVKVVKNKVAPPFREAEFDIVYGEGVSRWGCVLDEAVSRGIVDQSGSWYSYGDLRLGNGKANSVQFMTENMDVAAEIEGRVYLDVGMEPPAPPPVAEVDGSED